MKTINILSYNIVHPNADCATPGVFAELATVLDWIKDKIGDCNEAACREGNCMNFNDLNEDALQAFQVNPYGGK